MPRSLNRAEGWFEARLRWIRQNPDGKGVAPSDRSDRKSRERPKAKLRRRSPTSAVPPNKSSASEPSQARKSLQKARLPKPMPPRRNRRPRLAKRTRPRAKLPMKPSNPKTTSLKARLTATRPRAPKLRPPGLWWIGQVGNALGSRPPVKPVSCKRPLQGAIRFPRDPRAGARDWLCGRHERDDGAACCSGGCAANTINAALAAIAASAPPAVAPEGPPRASDFPLVVLVSAMRLRSPPMLFHRSLP